MVSSNWIRRKLGAKGARTTIPLGSAIRAVGHFVRIGRRNKLLQTGDMPENKRQEKILAEFLKRRAQIVQKAADSPKLAAIESKIHLVRRGMALVGLNPAVKPDIYHVLGITALRYGLDSKALLVEARELYKLYSSVPGRGSFSGSPIQLIAAIGKKIKKTEKNYPSSLELELYAAGERSQNYSGHNILNSKELVTALGLEWAKSDRQMINVSLQFLEATGFVRKMPEITNSRRGVISMWVHHGFKPSLYSYIDSNGKYRSVQMDILNRIYHGATHTTDLYVETHSRVGKSGNPTATFAIMPVLDAIKKLKTAGLIETKSEKITGTVKSGAAPHGATTRTTVTLTTLGRTIWARTLNTGVLDEKLIELLVDEKRKRRI